MSYQSNSPMLVTIFKNAKIKNSLVPTNNSLLNGESTTVNENMFVVAGEGAKLSFETLTVHNPKQLDRTQDKTVDNLASISSKTDDHTKEYQLNRSTGKQKHIAFSDTKILQTDFPIERKASEGSNRATYILDFEGISLIKKVKSDTSKITKGADSKILIILEILEELLDKVEENIMTSDHCSSKSVLAKFSLDEPPQTTSQIKSTTYVSIKDRIKAKHGKSKDGKKSCARRKYDKDSLKKTISKVIIDLKLPIKIYESKPFLDIKVDVEKVVSGDDPPSSTAILSEMREVEELIDDTDMDLTSSIGGDSTSSVPFEMDWCFGFNPAVPIINLSCHNKFLVLFAYAQFPVLHNFCDGTMCFLQGHRNEVSCLASDLTGSLIVSTDCGPGSRIIIWDLQPIVIDVLEHPQGCRLVALSNPPDYLVSITPFPDPVIQLWNQNKPKILLAERRVTEKLGEVRTIAMNPLCPEELALSQEFGVEFFYFNKEGGVENSFIVNSHQLSNKLGTVTDTTFVAGNRAKALTSTSFGYVVMWVEEEGSRHKKIHEKYVRLSHDTITHIKAVDDVVAIATGSGNVSFFDPDLMGLHWNRSMLVGPLVSLSFNVQSEKKAQELCKHKSKTSCAACWCQPNSPLVEATLLSRPFVVRNFIISTESGKVAFCNTSNSIPKYILYPLNGIYTAIDVLPNSKYLCAGTSLGRCILFDLSDRKIKVTQQLSVAENECQAISALRYSPSGLQLVCGMMTGALWLLHPLLLTPRTPSPLTDCSHSITHIAFSDTSGSNYFAVADASWCITVYSLQNPPVLVGQYQAHHNSIRDLHFTSNESGIKLLTVGADRNIVQFDIHDNNLELKSVQRVEQTAIPCCIAPYPPARDQLVMLNSEMKFKLLDRQTMKCCKTIRAPDLAGDNLIFLEAVNERLMVFGTPHHLGLQALPLDGNPFKSIALWASPSPMVSCKVHTNGNYLFTISENATAICMWHINVGALSEYERCGGKGLKPYLSMLEGWRETDLREFFMVGQFVHQGEKPSIVRTLSNSLPICEMVNVFQALGFFPTKYQIQNIMFEVAKTEDEKTLKKMQINFDDFVRLYLNHRPYRELTIDELQSAFLDFYAGVYYADRDSHMLHTEPIFNTVTFFDKLLETGEEITFHDAYKALTILFDDKSSIPADLRIHALPFMPKELHFETFVRDVLGFQTEEPVN